MFKLRMLLTDVHEAAAFKDVRTYQRRRLLHLYGGFTGPGAWCSTLSPLLDGAQGSSGFLGQFQDQQM